MTEALQRAFSHAESVRSYHARSKHRLERYAAGPETLDWTEQPNPFREYDGSLRVPLPLGAGRIDRPFASLREPLTAQSYALSLQSVGVLLELSLGLSAWKQYGPDRWAVRCTPSSGNLHPTEGYVLTRRLPGLEDGLYHYLSRDHALEQRCRMEWTTPQQSDSGLWIGLSSVYWREAWKYGERAFRYCQLDTGHAVGALNYAAAVLDWRLRVVQACDNSRLGRLLGTHRRDDFIGAEPEEPELLLAVIPQSAPGRSRLDAAASSIPCPASSKWRGRANTLDAHPMYHWPVIDEVAAASANQAASSDTPREAAHWPYPPLRPASASTSGSNAVDVIRARRSAQRFDSKYAVESADFFHLMDCLLTRSALPWDCWEFTPRAHALMFVHRVQGLAPGLYALPRHFQAEAALRNTLRRDFLWRRAESAPRHLPLFQLQLGDYRQLARTLCCRQALASDSSVTLAVLSEFESTVVERPWRYRQLFWEAGMLGQVLYLEAQALGLSGTGIGCYFDDALHELLGLRDERYQCLYQFTIGRALVDPRIGTQPPYAHRQSEPGDRADER